MPDFAMEAALWTRGVQHIAGVDEAGRGPLAGPVVAAAVILPPHLPPGLVLDDSKRLSAQQRERLFAALRRVALAWRAVAVSAAEIDRVNILQATLLAMTLAVSCLRPRAQFALIDGNRLPRLDIPAEAVVRGDQRCNSVAAASIVAKVARDRIMTAYGARYPQWGFERHKGYGTEAHRAALQRVGPSPIHRRTFRCAGL
ncbi:MAG: ribonuclease HII [Candidatus Lambdaproteobacteria bacterium]|nr:ribonuclease HII [Candidatus Lambdaproteobacteria bacterium]